MANGATPQGSQQPQETPAAANTTDITAKNLQETLAAIFGKTAAAVPGGAVPTIMTPGKTVTGPPQVMPGSQSTAGATSGGLPPTPSGVPNAPRGPVGLAGGQMDYATPAGARGAVASSALSGVVEAINRKTDQKKQENIQHAKFLYDMASQANLQGDQSTVNFIMQDSKNVKLIEKYLTGALPKVPAAPQGGSATQQSGQQPQGGAPGGGQQPQPQAKPQASAQLPAVNQPGGVVMPQAGPQAQAQARFANMVNEGLKNGDPRIVAGVLGEAMALDPAQYKQAMEQKFGLVLSPEQIATMNNTQQDALIKAKGDVAQHIISQNELFKRQTAVADIRGKAAKDVAHIQADGRLAALRDYRAYQLELKKAAPDKMAEVQYKASADLYRGMALRAMQSASDIMKSSNPSPVEAKKFEDEAHKWAEKGEQLKADWDNQKEYENILKDMGDTANAPDSAVPLDNEPADATEK
jgi:hypothetical protein